MRNFLKVLLVIVVLVVFALGSCRSKDDTPKEVLAIDVTEDVVFIYEEGERMGWDWSAVDFDDYNWFQRLFRKKPTKFTVEIYVQGIEHRVEFRNSEGDLIAFAYKVVKTS